MNYLYEAIKPARLYIKQCPHCGLKYFGKSVRQDIEKYPGSGVRWTSHLAKHKVKAVHLWNSDWHHDTSIKRFALKFSRMNKIVGSNAWANLREEDGLEGGNTFSGRRHTPETIEKMKLAAIKRPPHSTETRNKIAKSKKGQGKGIERLRSQEHQQNLTKSLQGKAPWNVGVNGYKNKSQQLTCPHCDVTGGSGGMKRSHFDFCKNNPNKKTVKKSKQKIVMCPCCGKTGGMTNMKRFHFENCKHQDHNEK